MNEDNAITDAQRQRHITGRRHYVVRWDSGEYGAVDDDELMSLHVSPDDDRVIYGTD